MSDARELVHAHAGLAKAMQESPAFAAVRDQNVLEIDGKQLYIVRGDTFGDEEDLFLEAVVRGAQQTDPEDPYRAVYLDLDEDARGVIDQRVQASQEAGGTEGDAQPDSFGGLT